MLDWAEAGCWTGRRRDAWTGRRRDAGLGGGGMLDWAEAGCWTAPSASLRFCLRSRYSAVDQIRGGVVCALPGLFE